MINIALPKGRLGNKVFSLLSSVGYECADLLEDNRKLVFVNEETIQYCGTFQANFRNSNGIARNAKVMIDVNNPNLEIYKFDFRD